ncbi:hypothetical protein CLF_111359 [Clonorchis sinensis]|uniref:Reverse transcriptase domain-containing protein n=1 Tax=Clonorchis sinensis TaxID=79923 RepID=G7YUQ0_CLOSI|nr:hypothetical protein CLF_111359 [Clonorchis sinensis]
MNILDDVYLVFEDENAQVFLDELIRVIPSFGMHFAPTECEVMLVDMQSLNAPLTIQGQELEACAWQSDEMHGYEAPLFVFGLGYYVYLGPYNQYVHGYGHGRRMMDEQYLVKKFVIDFYGDLVQTTGTSSTKLRNSAIPGLDALCAVIHSLVSGLHPQRSPNGPEKYLRSYIGFVLPLKIPLAK